MRWVAWVLVAPMLAGCLGFPPQESTAPPGTPPPPGHQEPTDSSATSQQPGAPSGADLLLLDPSSGNLYMVGATTRTVANGFQGAQGVTVDPWGRVLVADTDRDRVVRMSLDGTGRRELSILGHGQGALDEPVGVAVDAAGRIFIVDKGHGRIVRVDDMSGTRATSFGWYQEDMAPGESTDEVGMLQFPSSVAVHPSNGRIVVADPGRDRIAAVDDLRGMGWATLKSSPGRELNRPAAVAFDAAGKIHIIDSHNRRLIRIDDMTGAGWTENQGGPGGFGYPTNLAVAPDGTAYVVDPGASRVHTVSPSGAVTSSAMPASPPSNTGPPPSWSIAVPRAAAGAPPSDASSAAAAFEADAVEVYVSDYKLARLYRFDGRDGQGWTKFGSRGNGVHQFTTPNHMAISSTGRIHIGDNGDQGQAHRAVWFDGMTGANWATIPTQGPQDPFDQPFALRLDAQGRIYAAGHNAIARIDDVTGGGWVKLGSPGTGASQFHNPTDIAFDSQGRIYVCDKDNSRIVRMNDITGAGWITLGSLGSGTHQFDTNIGMTIDGQDRILVADEHNHRVVRFNDMTGAGWTVLSKTAAAGERITLPHDVAVSPAGKIYIMDTGHARVVRVDDMDGSGWVNFGTRGAMWRVDNTAGGLDEIGVAKGVALRPL